MTQTVMPHPTAPHPEPAEGRTTSAQAADPPLLQVRSLSKSYGDIVGCRDVSFEIWPGEVVGIVGESGSGKTTVLDCVSGRLPASAGQVLYAPDGADPGPRRGRLVQRRQRPLPDRRGDRERESRELPPLLG